MTQRAFNAAAGTIFLAVAVLHALRLFRGWEVLIAGWHIPMWVSWAGLALADLDAMRAKYPDDPLILRYRGRTLEKLGRRKEAIAAYRRILAADPKQVPARLFLGLAYAKEGRRESKRMSTPAARRTSRSTTPQRGYPSNGFLLKYRKT